MAAAGSPVRAVVSDNGETASGVKERHNGSV